MKQPFFSIVIPTRGRPKYLRDAIVSVLRQDFEDLEVVVSDNYNDGQTGVVVDEFKDDRRFRCVRTDRLLNMPEHWDFATQHAGGQYVLILTDRSVLKQGALNAIYEAISLSEEPVEVCSWRWSLYDDSKGRECGAGSMFNDKHAVNISSRRLAEEFANGLGEYVYFLPRGLNSCYKSTLMKRIREEFGTPFMPISPDYYSAFVIMGTTQEVVHIDRPLVVFQGNADSNGGRGMAGVDTGYFNDLGGYDIHAHVPIKSPLLKNTVFEDFFAVREAIGGNLKDVECDWPVYFETCYYELLIKKEAGILSSCELDVLFCEWERALSTFDQTIQRTARERVELLIKSFAFPPHLECIRENTIKGSYIFRVKSWLKNLISAPREEKWQSVLEIAGFC